MNIKNNKRRRDSQDKIEKAFIELLQTREIKDITVSDLIKMTELNRSTFYANYIDIFDLADKTREKLEAIIEKSYATYWKKKRLDARSSKRYLNKGNFKNRARICPVFCVYFCAKTS